jgi:hypothetical protein
MLANKYGWLSPPLLSSRRLDQFEIKESTLSRSTALLEEFSLDRATGTGRAAGFAHLPSKYERPADLVVLTYRDAEGVEIVFATAAVGGPPASALRFGYDSMFSASTVNDKNDAWRWSTEFKLADIPEDAIDSITAWAIQIEEMLARRIPRK